MVWWNYIKSKHDEATFAKIFIQPSEVVRSIWSNEMNLCQVIFPNTEKQYNFKRGTDFQKQGDSWKCSTTGL